MSGFGTTPVTGGPPVGTPVGSVAVPNHVGGNLTALRGASASTDSNGNETAAVSAVIENVNPNGQNTMVNSAPVVIASDQLHAGSNDGIVPAQVPALGNYLYSAGGPVDSTGKPQQASWDRVASWQGKAVQGASGNITTTVAGDNNLVFSVAPKTIMPGQRVQLSIGTGSPIETVIVSTTYVPSSTATTIPLQFPVVNASSTTAKWDAFFPNGPGLTAMTSNNLPVTMLAAYNANGPNPVALVTASLDAQSVLNILAASPGLYNGATIDRMRNNTDVTLLASAARAATQTSADQVNYNGRGIKMWVDITSAGTATLTPAILGKDPASGKYISIITSAALSSNNTYTYTIYPGAAGPGTSPTFFANDILPRTFQIVTTYGGSGNITYSVGYSLIL
jgi:hypothetical protein